MYRLFRLMVVCFVIVMISLTLDTQTTQAKWYRSGDEAYAIFVSQVCEEGVVTGAAYAWTGADNPNFSLGDLTLRIRIIPTTGDEFYSDDLPPRPPSFQADFDITAQNEPQYVGNTNFPSDAPVITYFYHIEKAKWQYRFDTSIYPYVDVHLYWVNSNFGTLYRGKGTFAVQDCSVPPWDPKDGRANVDAGASAVIYCDGDMVKVYSVNGDSRGTLSFVVLIAEVNTPELPLLNTFIASGPHASGGEIRLYRLTTGEWQINAPGLPPESWKEYVFIWNGC